MSFSSSKAYLLITLIAYSTFSLPLSQEFDFEIDDFSSQNAQDILIFDRDAFVPEGSTFARLIKTDASGYPAQYSVGRVLYKWPITFWKPGKQLSFEVTLQFEITAVNNDPANGMTFFIVPVDSITPTGGEGDGLGIFGALAPNSSIFAIEFDVYNKDQWQSYRHIGIDINSRPPRNTTILEDGALNREVTALIEYEATTRRISVSVTYGYGSIHSEVSYVYDLKTSLPQHVQIGVSAATGKQVGIFDILKWYFIGTLVDDNTNEETYVKQYV